MLMARPTFISLPNKVAIDLVVIVLLVIAGAVYIF
jgi:hypothetical protein